MKLHYPHHSCPQQSNLENVESAHCSPAVVFHESYVVQWGIRPHGQQATSTPLYLPVQTKTCKTECCLCILCIWILCLYVSTVFGVFFYFAWHTSNKQQALLSTCLFTAKRAKLSGAGVFCVFEYCICMSHLYLVYSCILPDTHQTSSKHSANTCLIGAMRAWYLATCEFYVFGICWKQLYFVYLCTFHDTWHGQQALLSCVCLSKAKLGKKWNKEKNHSTQIIHILVWPYSGMDVWLFKIQHNLKHSSFECM